MRLRPNFYISASTFYVLEPLRVILFSEEIFYLEYSIFSKIFSSVGGCPPNISREPVLM